MRIDRDAVKRAAPLLVPAVRAWHRWLTAWRSRPSYVAAHAPFLQPDAFDRVHFDNRGNHPTQHVRTTARFVDIAGARVLAVGCREGRELALWLDRGARSVTTLDYIPRPDVWRSLGLPARSVRFLAGDARRLPFADDTFDIVSSEALLEHVVHPDLAIAEFHRVAKPGGVVYSIFGPLYFTAGGAHYPGDYDHLLQGPDEFVAWLRARRNPGDAEGLGYLDAGMFSEWTADQYLHEFRKYHVLRSAVFLSPEARRFRARHPGDWSRLRATYAERDLLISGLAFWSRK
ncbi:MAG: class I SAM-dependent methyltransferase [Acidobacteria bacterium]|nr:class I SAM-dependent methyltransferase [Acidobacteriota bacterium]